MLRAAKEQSPYVAGNGRLAVLPWRKTYLFASPRRKSHAMPFLSRCDRPGQSTDTAPSFPPWFRGVVLAALVVYWGVLAVATHVPSVSAEPSPSATHDKLDHCVAFAGLAFLLVWSWWVCAGRLRPWAVMGVAATYGALDEWLQGLVPTRVPDVWDWVADVVGAGSGTVMAMVTILWVLRRTAGRPAAQPPAPETPS